MRWGLTATHLEHLVGAGFVIRTEGSPRLRLVLGRLERLPPPPFDPDTTPPAIQGGPREEPFRLLFIGPEKPTVPRGIHTLQQDELGHLELFLVPLGPDITYASRYEAVFT